MNQITTRSSTKSIYKTLKIMPKIKAFSKERPVCLYTFPNNKIKKILTIHRKWRRYYSLRICYRLRYAYRSTS